jgi:two-component system, response regulator PdtaR
MTFHVPHPQQAVLVVEDEPLIRLVATDTLEDAGFAAFEASDARQAIALLERHEEIRILFTDVNMPGDMDGVSLAHYVRDHWPEVKIVVTTGRCAVAQPDLPEGSALLPKPYRMAHLIGTLRELTAAGTGIAGEWTSR